VDSAADGILLVSAAGRILSLNPAALAMFDYPDEAALRGQSLDLLIPAALDAWQAKPGRESGALELLGVRTGGAEFPIELSIGSFETAGSVVMAAIIRDATARKAAESALAQSSERLRLALEAGGMGAWDFDPATQEVSWDARQSALFGLALPAGEVPRALPFAAFLALVLPQDRADLLAAVELAIANDTGFAHEFRIRHADTGRERWLAGRGKLVPGARGGRLLGLNWDVTERREAEDRQMLLMREVDHRAKNSLAVVQSVLALTRASDLGGFRTAVAGRIGAMARAHTLLARTAWDAADLDALLRDELGVHLGGGKVSLAGPVVGLAPGAAQPVAMALHELATNAAKYGALSAPAGQVALRWSRLPDGGLCLRWRETGGPPVAGAPARQGFGSVLVTRTVERQLQGRIRFEWHRAGLECRLMLPAQAVRWPTEPSVLLATG
jgi:PAS domain S-box-containing protein